MERKPTDERPDGITPLWSRRKPSKRVGRGQGWLPAWAEPALAAVADAAPWPFAPLAAAAPSVLGELPGIVGKRFNEIPNPLEAPVSALGSAFSAVAWEAPAEAVKYGAGVAIGGMQQAAEAVGARQPGETIDVRADARNLPLAPLARAVAGPGQGIARQLGLPMVSDLLPENLEPLYSLLDTGEPRMLPPVTDLFSPAEASARFQAVTPEPLEVLVDLTAGFIAPARAARLVKSGVAGAGERLGLNKFAEVKPSPRIERFSRGAQKLAESKPGRAAGMAARTLPIVAGVKAATEQPPIDPDTGLPLEGLSWYATVGGQALIGMMVGGGVARGLLGVGALARAGAMRYTPIVASASPELKSSLEHINEANAAKDRGWYTPMLAPGGTLGMALANTRHVISDSLALIKDTSRIVLGRRASGLAQQEATTALPKALDEFNVAYTAYEKVVPTFDAAELQLSQAQMALKAAMDYRKTLPRKATDIPGSVQPHPSTAAWQALIDEPDDAALAKRLLASMTDDFDEFGQPIKKVVLAPGIEATMAAGRKPSLVSWHQSFGSTGTRSFKRMGDVIKMARSHAQREIRNLPQVTTPPTANIHLAADIQAANAAIDIAERGLGGAKTAQAAAGESLREAHRAQYVAAERAKLLTLASKTVPGSPEARDNIGMLAQMRAGLSGQQQYETDRTKLLALLPRTHRIEGTDKVIEWGLKRGGGDASDVKAFDTWRWYQKAVQVVERGGTVMHPDKTEFTTVDQIRKAMDDYVEQYLGGDWRTIDRYERTALKLSARRNEIAGRAAADGIITKRDYQAMLDDDFLYIRAEDVKSYMDNWRETGKRQATGKELFSTLKVFQREDVKRGLMHVDLQDQLEADELIIRSIELNRISRAMVKNARADPMGMGMGFRQRISISETTAKALVEARERAVEMHKTASQTLRDAEGQLAREHAQATKIQDKITSWTQTQSNSANATLRAQATARLKYWNTKLQGRTAAIAQAQDAANIAKQSKAEAEGMLKSVREQARGATGRAKESALRSEHSELRGTSMIPYWNEKGELEIWDAPSWYKDLALAVDEPMANLFFDVTGTWSQRWRSTVTTLSLPFAQRNIWRDAEAMMQNMRKYGKETTPGQVAADYTESVLEALQIGGVGAWRDLVRGFDSMLPLPGKGRISHESFAKRIADAEDLLAKSTWSQMAKTRAVGSTFIEQGGPVAGTVLNPLSAIRKIALMSEMPARMTVFKTAKRAGLSDLEAGYEARTVLTDFSKAGTMVRSMNLVFPLLNARFQGELQSWNAFQEDPAAYIGRVTATATIPYLAIYTLNRTLWGDMLDEISTEEQVKNAHLIYGSYYDEERGKEMPLYFKIPINDVAMAFITPLRLALDEQYHTRTNKGVPLAPGQRSNWTPPTVLKSIVANFIPTNPKLDELDPAGLFSSLLSMNPVYAVSSQMGANWNRFWGRPVRDPDAPDVPAEYLVTENTPLFSQAMTELFNQVGSGHLAPVEIDFALKMAGGSLMAPPLSYASDAIINLALRRFGWQPYSERSLPSDVPKDVAAEYLRWRENMKKRSAESVEMQIIPALFGAGGSAQTIIQKVKNEDPTTYRIWTDSLGLTEARRVHRATVYQPALNTLYTDLSYLSNGEVTHAVINDQAIAKAQQNRAWGEGVRDEKFPKALKTSKERRDFLKRVPGIPVGVEFEGAKQMLPQEVDVNLLAQRYLSPGGADPAIFAAMDPVVQAGMQSKELTAMARELTTQYGVPVDPRTLQRAINAAQQGESFPALPLLEDDVDEWLDRWQAPQGRDISLLPSQDAQQRREEELRAIVEENSLIEIMMDEGLMSDDPNLGDEMDQAKAYVEEIINTKFVSVNQSPLERSRNDAYSTSSRVNDDRLHPRYANANGTIAGDPETDWDEWDAELRAADMSGVADEDLPPRLRLLAAYRSYGKVGRVLALYSDRDYDDYARWFGAGRQMNPLDWDRMLKGEWGKYQYQVDGETRTVPFDIARQLDMLVALYSALPAGSPERETLKPYVAVIRKAATPKWATYFKFPEVQTPLRRQTEEEQQALEEAVVS